MSVTQGFIPFFTHHLALLYMASVRLEVLPISCPDPHANTVLPSLSFTPVLSFAMWLPPHPSCMVLLLILGTFQISISPL